MRLLRRAPILLALAAVPGSAAAEGPPDGTPVRHEVAVDTADGMKLAADLFEPAGGGEGKGAVVALHHEGGDRKAWTPLGELLSKHGISLLALDLRGHGGSRTQAGEDLGPRAEARDPALWKAMAADVEAGLRYLRGTLLADGKKLGIVGLSAGAALALAAGEKDEKLRAVLTVAAAPSGCGVPGMASATRWKERPLGLLAGQGADRGDAGPLLREIPKHPRGEVLLLPDPAKTPPAEFAGSPRCAAEATQFFVGWFERPHLTGKQEEGVSHGNGIFVSGSSIRLGMAAGGLTCSGYEAPGNVTGLCVLADPDPTAKKLGDASRRITVTPLPGKAGGVTVAIDRRVAGAWKRDRAYSPPDVGAFVVDGKTTFWEVWLSPAVLGVVPFTRIAVQPLPLLDGAPKRSDRTGFPGEAAKPAFSESVPASWESWELL